MNRIVRLKKIFPNNKTSGFSYIEAVVSLLIISLICILMSSVYSVSVKSITNTQRKIKSSLTHLKVDQEIREFISSVDYPLWIKEYKIESSPNSITVEYFKGKEGETSKTFSDIEIIECDFLRTLQKEPAGVFVKYKLDDIEYETKVLFASFPYGAIKL